MLHSLFLHLVLCLSIWNGPLVCLAAPSSSKLTSHPSANIKNGTVVGIHSDTWNQDFFLGVPFAQPPIGNLRLARPQPINKTWPEPLLAQEYGPFCYGRNLSLVGFDQETISYSQDEDCLTINIVRPSNCTQTTGLPVLAWIYGGGFQEGGSGDARYNMSYLVQTATNMGKPIIGVSFNYRLGPFGFLSGQPFRDQGLTNLGFHDQRLALQWIQDNIAAFGGDAARVTLQGESAGALSIGLHMLANSGRDDGLFHGAIAESGGPFFHTPFPTNATQDAMLATLAKLTGCGGTSDTVSCFKSLSVESFQNASVAASQVWNPVLDGELFTQLASVALQEGAFVHVPLLIGANTNEGTAFLPMFTKIGVNSSSDVKSTLLTWGSGIDLPTDVVDQLAGLYANLDRAAEELSLGTVEGSPGYPYGSYYGRTSLLIGDLTMIGGRRITAQAWSNHSIDAYSYRFDTVPAGIDPKTLGVAHFQEVAYVFGNTDGLGYDDSPFSISPPELLEKHLDLSDLMGRMWISFVNTGSPNHHEVSWFNVTWPKYNAGNPQNMVFNASVGSRVEEDTFRTEQINLMRDYAAQFGR